MSFIQDCYEACTSNIEREEFFHILSKKLSGHKPEAQVLLRLAQQEVCNQHLANAATRCIKRVVKAFPEFLADSASFCVDIVVKSERHHLNGSAVREARQMLSTIARREPKALETLFDSFSKGNLDSLEDMARLNVILPYIPHKADSGYVRRLCGKFAGGAHTLAQEGLSDLLKARRDLVKIAFDFAEEKAQNGKSAERAAALRIYGVCGRIDKTRAGKACDALIEAGLKDVPSVRKIALYELDDRLILQSEKKPETIFDYAKKIAASDKSEEVRCRAISLASRADVEREKMVDFFRDCFKDPSLMVKEHAVRIFPKSLRAHIDEDFIEDILRLQAEGYAAEGSCLGKTSRILLGEIQRTRPDIFSKETPKGREFWYAIHPHYNRQRAFT